METQAPAFAAVRDAFLSWYYRHHPVSATFIGVHDDDDRLPDYSARGTDDLLAGIDALERDLRRLPAEPLSEAEALDRRLIEGCLEILRWERRDGHFHRSNPCVYTGEAVFGVLALFLRTFAPLRQRVDAAVARMRGIPDLLGTGRQVVRRAPAAWTRRAIRECQGALAFFERGVHLLVREEGISVPEFLQAAETAASAFREFDAYLQAHLLRNTTEGYACGGEALDLLIRRGHFLDIDADDVAALGEAHLAAADGALAALASDLGAPSWREALADLADLHPPVDRYYTRYEEVWREARAAAETHDLVTWPDYPIRYVPQPAWAREAAPHLYFLSYRAPAAFDRVPVVDYLVTPIEPGMPPEEQARRLHATNESVIKLNHVIHHGGLGHHVQNWYAYRAASRVGRIAAVDCASRIAMFCGGTMAEGWACYATDLMEEIGYVTPPERLAQAHTRLRMAARAVVDVRLHRGEWPLERAVACYRDQVGMSAEAAQGEAVKNSMFPGAALMYLVGSHMIHDLRRDLAARRRDVSLRGFHDRFLSYGSVPVALIAQAMRASV